MARRFRFKLEAVQKLRKQARDAQRRQLANVLLAFRQKEAMILGYEARPASQGRPPLAVWLGSGEVECHAVEGPGAA